MLRSRNGLHQIYDTCKYRWLVGWLRMWRWSDITRAALAKNWGGNFHERNVFSVLIIVLTRFAALMDSIRALLTFVKFLLKVISSSCTYDVTVERPVKVQWRFVWFLFRFHCHRHTFPATTIRSLPLLYHNRVTISTEYPRHGEKTPLFLRFSSPGGENAKFFYRNRRLLSILSSFSEPYVTYTRERSRVSFFPDVLLIHITFYFH